MRQKVKVIYTFKCSKCGFVLEKEPLLLDFDEGYHYTHNVGYEPGIAPLHWLCEAGYQLCEPCSAPFVDKFNRLHRDFGNYVNGIKEEK